MLIASPISEDSYYSNHSQISQAQVMVVSQ